MHVMDWHLIFLYATWENVTFHDIIRLYLLPFKKFWIRKESTYGPHFPFRYGFASNSLILVLCLNLKCRWQERFSLFVRLKWSWFYSRWSGSKYEVGMYVQTLKVKNNVAQLYNWNEYRENIILTLSILPSMFLPSTYGN